MPLPDKAANELRMRELVAFTRTSLSTAHPSPFGSSVYDLRSGELVSQSYDTVIAETDPTNHAEVNAIRLATRRLGRLSLAGHVLYSTCEPCPMCMSACLWAELELVVFGASTMEDANAYWPQSSDVTPQELAQRGLREPGCAVLPHVERAACQALFHDCDAELASRELRLPPHR